MTNKTQVNCAFCNIIQGLEKGYVVFEDNNFIAILDKRPLFLGHNLLIPKTHVQTFYDLPEQLIKPFFKLAQHLGKAIELATASQGSFIAMNNQVSQSVPHFHLHIVPRNPNDGLRGFFWPRQKYLDEQQMIDMQNKIKQQLLNISDLLI